MRMGDQAEKHGRPIFVNAFRRQKKSSVYEKKCKTTHWHLEKRMIPDR
jgi:hypothetical protein